MQLPPLCLLAWECWNLRGRKRLDGRGHVSLRSHPWLYFTWVNGHLNSRAPREGFCKLLLPHFLALCGRKLEQLSIATPLRKRDACKCNYMGKVLSGAGSQQYSFVWLPSASQWRDSSLSHLIQSKFQALMANSSSGSTSEWGADASPELMPVQETKAFSGSSTAFRHGQGRKSLSCVRMYAAGSECNVVRAFLFLLLSKGAF